MQGNPFDEGIVLTDGPSGGYTMSLASFRQYYTINVLGTGALSEAQFQKEFPKAYAALVESDQRQAEFQTLLKNPQAAQAVFEVLKHMGAGKPIELHEAFPPSSQGYKPPAVPPKPNTQGGPPQQGQVPPAFQKPQGEDEQPTPPPTNAAPNNAQQPPMAAGGTDNHTHNLNCDASGNGETDACATDGHIHPVQGGKVMPVNNHTHEIAAQQGNAPPQNKPMSQGGA